LCEIGAQLQTLAAQQISIANNLTNIYQAAFCLAGIISKKFATIFKLSLQPCSKLNWNLMKNLKPLEEVTEP